MARDAGKLRRAGGLGLLCVACALCGCGGGGGSGAGGAGDPGLIQNPALAGISDTTARILWDSVVPATSRIEYGLDTSYGTRTEEEGLSYFHMTRLSGLAPGTTYHYRIRARGENFDSVTGDLTFTTRTEAEVEGLIRDARADGGLPRTYYVKPDGNDGADGLTVATAWQRPSTAVSRSDAGDTIYLLSGTWSGESISFPRSGIDVAPITLAAYPGATVALTNTGDFVIGTGLGAEARSYVDVRGLRIDGEGIRARGGVHIRISDCEVFNTPGIGVYFVDVKYGMVERCDVHDNGWNSVMFQSNYRADAGHVALRDSRVHDNPGMSGAEGHNLVDLFNYQEALSYIEVSGNTLYNGAQKGIFQHNSPDSRFRYLMVRNNVVVNTHDAVMLYLTDTASVLNNTCHTYVSTGIVVWDPTTSSGITIKNNITAAGYRGISADHASFVVAYNDSWGNSNGNYRAPAGTGNLELDPLFADAANLDFHLKSAAGRWNGATWVQDAATSPCIDAADPVSLFDREPTPNGGRANLGAYGNTLEASKSP